jgi:hypothetical protein
MGEPSSQAPASWHHKSARGLLFSSVPVRSRFAFSARLRQDLGMKVLPASIAAAALLISSVFAQGPVNQLLTEAQTAYLRGDLAAAKAKFESVRTLDPKNATAIGYLRQIAVKEAEGGGSPEKALSKLIVPSVQFKEAELSAVLDALKKQVATLSGGKQSANFVIQLPEAKTKLPITLSLTNVPFTEVLKYIGTLADVTFSFDKYAILVRPASAAGGEPKAEEPPKIKGL